MPYRIEHFMHLELEWTVWMPLAFWALHRAFDTRSSKAGVWVGLFICLQVLSCVYYGVFLSIVVSLIAILMIASRPAESWRPLPGLAAGALIGAVISGIYAMPYRDSASIVGSRGLDEIALYSATPLSYLASPYWNWLYGWTADRFGSGELRLFPGLVALGLAVIGFTRGPRRLVWIYLTVVLLVVELSFGLNGFIYPWLLRHVPPLHGFRVAARFSALAFAALSVLVAFGFANFRPSRFSPGKWLVIVLAALRHRVRFGAGAVETGDVRPAGPLPLRAGSRSRGRDGVSLVGARIAAARRRRLPVLVDDALEADGQRIQRLLLGTLYQPARSACGSFPTTDRSRPFGRRACATSSSIARAISGANTPTSCPTSPPAAISCRWDDSATPHDMAQVFALY